MHRRGQRFALAAVVTVVGALAIASLAAAGPTTVYCLNGVSTTMPAGITAASVSAGSDTAVLSESLVIDLITKHGGSFAYGYFPGNVGGFNGWSIVVAGDPITSADLEPGWTANTVAVGACVAAATPGITHVGVCKLLPRGDGTTGLFQEITVPEWNDRDGRYFDAPAANWVEGLGLTCDDPLALGYKATGTKVAWGGRPDPGNQPNGVRAAGLNDIYPLFVR